MALEKLKPAKGSVKKIKRVGRGQGSGMGKTSTRGGKGQTARTGYKAKRGFEGGQQPLQRSSKVSKPYVINVDKAKKIFDLNDITIDILREHFSIPLYTKEVKIIGTKANELITKIKDEAVRVSGSTK